jgi:hypothetical protein
MREWICFVLAVTSLSCSGGRDPVHTVGGDREYPGPGASDPYGEGSDEGSATTSISTLVALCTKACAHVHAADCAGAPAHETDGCEGQCLQELTSAPLTCADESAALYTCTINAKITCSADVSAAPTVGGCDLKSNALQECIVPGSDCAIAPLNDDLCKSMGFSSFVICTEGIEPPIQCLQVAANAFCCP